MRIFLLNFVTLACIVIGSNTLVAQETDIQSWSWVKAQIPINDRWTVDAFPIFRRFMDLSELQNISADIYVKGKLTDLISVAVLSRSHYVPDGDFRQFFFYDLITKIPINHPNFNLSHRLRFHHGVDVKDNLDADFFRNAMTLSFPNNSVFTPLVSLELFSRLNKQATLGRVRGIVGMNVKLPHKLSLNLNVWSENFVSPFGTTTNYILITGLNYKFNKLKKDNPEN